MNINLNSERKVRGPENKYSTQSTCVSSLLSGLLRKDVDFSITDIVSDS